MLLLVWGGRTLIDPSNRHSGEVGHVYITVIAFEAYIWLLLMVARWQASRGLARDVARFGLFAIFLQGAVFMAVNELHMAAQGQGLVVTAVVIALAIAKLMLGTKWMGISLPAPLAISCVTWIVAMAVPGVILRAYGIDFSTNPFTINYGAQHATAFIACWVLAVLVGLHVPLVAWQRKRGFGMGSLLQRWWVGWLISLALLAMAVAQLYTAMWGLWVDWSQWYFSPVYIAIAVVAVALSIAAGRGRALAWGAMGLAGLHFIITYSGIRPEHLFAGWKGGAANYVLHPLYPNGAFFCVMFAASAYFLRYRLFWLVAAVLPVTLGAYKLLAAMAVPVSTGTQGVVDSIRDSKYGKGVALLLGAFVLLGAGVALQWRREQRRLEQEKREHAGAQTPPPIPTDRPAGPSLEQVLSGLDEENASSAKEPIDPRPMN